MLVGEVFDVTLDIEVDAGSSPERSLLEGHECGMHCVSLARQMVYGKGCVTCLFVLCLRDHAFGEHSGEDGFLSVDCFFEVLSRVVACWRFWQACKQGGFGERQVFGVF